jgi:hypothetical protein
MAVSLLLLLPACQTEQQDADEQAFGAPTAIIPEYPIWVNASCPGRSIRLFTANVPPEYITIRLDKAEVEVEPEPVDGSRNNLVYWNVNIPSDQGHRSLSIVKQTDSEEVRLATSSILYVLPDEEVRLFNHYTTLEPPSQATPSACWPDYDGPVIPGGQTFTLSYDEKQTDRVFMSDMRRTIQLSEVKLKENQSGTVYPIEPPLEYTATIPDVVKLIGQVEGLAGIDLGNKGRSVSMFEVTIKAFDSKADATPSYRVVEREYGSQVLLRIKDCETADTLSSEPFIVPDLLQVELNCQPK